MRIWTTLAASKEKRPSLAALRPPVKSGVIEDNEAADAGGPSEDRGEAIGDKPNEAEALAQAQAMRETSSPEEGEESASGHQGLQRSFWR